MRGHGPVDLDGLGANHYVDALFVSPRHLDERKQNKLEKTQGVCR